MLKLDSAQKMERILMLEQELRFAKAKVGAQEIDLKRWEQKNWEWAQQKVSEMEWPRANSYWSFEGPKLKQRVLELEMELETLRSKTLWKD